MCNGINDQPEVLPPASVASAIRETPRDFGRAAGASDAEGNRRFGVGIHRRSGLQNQSHHVSARGPGFLIGQGAVEFFIRGAAIENALELHRPATYLVARSGGSNKRMSGGMEKTHSRQARHPIEGLRHH